MKQIVGLLAVLVLAVLLVRLLPLGAPSELGPVARHYVERGIEENRGANLVTSVVVNYRGFDTLGEVTVLFLSVAGAGFVLRRRGVVLKRPPVPASEILETAGRMLFGPIILYGVYIFVHGHLTPGGGFQGGAVIASGVLLLILMNRDLRLPHGAMGWIESSAGFLYVMVGLAGLVLGGSFLANRGVLPLGTWNTLFSAGLIPVIYTLVGLKVGTELSVMLEALVASSGRASGEGDPS